MSRSIDDEFEFIVQDALSHMASVRCSPSDYRQGLRYLIETAQVEIRASQETDPRLRDDEMVSK